MTKTYTKPELKVISFSESADVIQTSGEQLPISTLAGVEEPMANYGATNFSIFNNQ